MSGPVPVVLVHGLRTSSTMWRAQVGALADHPVVAVDLPGHGTRRGERFTVAGSLATIDAAVESLGGRAVVVGLSLGGYLAVAWAARHPASAVAVLAAGCSARPGGPLTRAWTLAARGIARLPDRGAWLNRTAVALAVPAAGARDLGAGGYALDVMVDALTEMAAVDSRADLAALRCPVWLVNGAWDHFRLGERGALRAAPGARLVLIPRATHLVSVVAPVAFSRVLLDLLAQVSVAAPAQTPGPHAADDAGRVRHDHDVVAERLEHDRPDPA